jgi:hypothetical protein
MEASFNSDVREIQSCFLGTTFHRIRLNGISGSDILDPLLKYHVMKTCGRMERKLRAFLTSALPNVAELLPLFLLFRKVSSWIPRREIRLYESFVVFLSPSRQISG